MIPCHHSQSQCAQNFLWTSLPWPIIRFHAVGHHQGFNSGPKVTKKICENQKFAFVHLGSLAPPCQAEDSASHHLQVQVIHKKHPACLRWLWNVSGGVPHQVSNLHMFIDVGPLFSTKYAMVTTGRIDIALQIKAKHIQGNIWLHEVMPGSDLVA